jgi:hypothetical protein
MIDWATALDRFEANLAQCRRVLDHGLEPATEPWPPADLTSAPIPGHLVKRAQLLLNASAELEHELIERRAALPEPRRSHRRHRRIPASTVSTVSTEL